MLDHACPRPVRYPRSAAVALATLLLLASDPRAVAQSEPTPADNNPTNSRFALLTQLNRKDVADWEAEFVAPPRGSGQSLRSFPEAAPIILKELAPALEGSYGQVRNSLAKLAEKAKLRKDDAKKEWDEVVRQRAAFRAFAEKRQAAYGFDFESGTHAGFKPDVFDVGLLGWACVVALVTLRLRHKELRLSIRQAQRAAAACLLVGTLGVSGCGSSAADARPWAVREEADLTEKLADATAKADAAEKVAEEKWEKAADSWAQLVSSRGPAKPDAEPIVRDNEKAIRDRLRTVVTEAKLADQLAKDAEKQRNILADEKAKLDDLVTGAKIRGYVTMAGRVGVAGLLFGLSIAPFWSARRARARRLRVAARTCPRCFRLNTLKVEKSGGGGSAARHKKGKKSDEEEPPEDDGGGEVRCGKCELRIRRSYLTVPRLCFPTVGVRYSGKTHLLVTAYDRIRKRTAATVAALQPAPSGGDVDRRFEAMADEVLHGRRGPAATDLVLPDPILVHAKEREAAGGESALVNLFDYSGELVNPDYDLNKLKETAVRMDGFMLFLDPTQLYGDDAGGVTLDRQLSSLDDFFAHMRKERKIPVGEVIPVPVAVCIPKFDLLLSDNPIGGQSVPYIRELTENLNPPPRQMTLDVLRERSELVEQMLPLMFPGVDIRGVVEGYFGRQVMFFPISSVSLFEHELGVKDLERRTVAPFGVTEPLMWLLYMHGYDVFA